MRIWDIHPGYLNRQSLLGEHREIHAIVSILTKGKKGYLNHPETQRWIGFGWALTKRHDLLVVEMNLRGYKHFSPVDLNGNYEIWPSIYVDEPSRQLQILHEKYVTKEKGRIPLPKNSQQLWSQHKYSVLARDPNFYNNIGPRLSHQVSETNFSDLVKKLTEMLRLPPSLGGIKNSLQHMWGHVNDSNPVSYPVLASWSQKQLLTEIQVRVDAKNEPYLWASTALSELAIWIQD